MISVKTDLAKTEYPKIFDSMYIDTHCHLDILETFGLGIEEVLKNCEDSGTGIVIQIATSGESSKWNYELAQNYNQNNKGGVKIFYTMGIHPETIREKTQLDSLTPLIEKHITDPYFAGIGETGLDFYQNPETKDIQIESFYHHLMLAKKYDLPVVVHCRDDRHYNKEKREAITKILQIAKEVNYSRGILHCFTYSYEEAGWFLELDWKISFSGIVTFKNATFLQEAAKKIPLSRILVETDAPFLAPIPFRGKTNQPAYIPYIVDFLAKLRNITGEELKEIILENALQTFTRIPAVLGNRMSPQVIT